MAAPAKFTPVQGKAPPPGKGTIPALPIFALILYILYFGLLIVGPKIVAQLGEELDPIFPSLWRLVGAVGLFLLLAIVIIVNLLSRTGTEAPSQPGIPGPKPPGPPPIQTAPPRFKSLDKTPEPKKVEVTAKKVVDEPVRSQMITYPLEVEGGIFGDTYIGLSPNKVLKLRSMVIEPEYLS